MIIKKCKIIFGNNSEIVLNSKKDEMNGNILCYSSDFDLKKLMIEEIVINNKFFRLFFRKLGKLFRSIADLCFGLESGFKPCCIAAYILKKDYHVQYINHKLCYNCYKKVVKNG